MGAQLTFRGGRLEYHVETVRMSETVSESDQIPVHYQF